MEKELSQLTNEELLEKRKKVKSENTTNAVIVGILVGISVYSTVINGLGVFTFFPIFFALFAAGRWKKNNDALTKELTSRNLK